MNSAEPAAKANPGSFVATRWSVVVRAGRNDTPTARAALATLCQAYWFPLYAQARRSGKSPHDAQDLTQGFFARLLADGTIAQADRARGRFRSFLLTAFKNFMADEWQRSQAQKRGGAVQLVSVDLQLAEHRFELEANASQSPDAAFDRQWALTLLQTVMTRLEMEARRTGKTAIFAVLKEALTGSRDSQPYAELAARLGSTEGAVKIAVHRLRKRYREILEDEIEHTVESPADVKAELDHLIRALAV